MTNGVCSALADDQRIDAREATEISKQIADAQALLAALDEQMCAIIEEGK